MPHDISLLQGVLAQQAGMVAKVPTAFRHFIGPSMPRLEPRCSARLWPATCAYSPKCVEVRFCEGRLWAFSDVRTELGVRGIMIRLESS